MSNQSFDAWLDEIATEAPDWELIGIFLDWCKDNNVDEETVDAIQTIYDFKKWPESIFDAATEYGDGVVYWYGNWEIRTKEAHVKRRGAILPTAFVGVGRDPWTDVINLWSSVRECLEAFIKHWKKVDEPRRLIEEYERNHGYQQV